MSTVRVDEGSLKEGLLGLALALVEIIADVLRSQAVRRMEGGGLTAEEVDALGRALRELDAAVAEIEAELGLAASVDAVRRSLDEAVAELLVRPVEEAFARPVREAAGGHGAWSEVVKGPWSTSTRL